MANKAGHRRFGSIRQLPSGATRSAIRGRMDGSAVIPRRSPARAMLAESLRCWKVSSRKAPGPIRSGRESS